MLSFGFATWLVIGYYAVSRHSRRLYVTAGVWLATTVVFVVVVGAPPDDLPLWRDALGVVLWVGVLIVGGTVLVASLAHNRPEDRPPEYRGPAAGQPADTAR
jgi:hypothetical protein